MKSEQKAACDFCGEEHALSALEKVCNDYRCIVCKEDTAREDEEEICFYCHGSGEGQYEGTTCWRCHGSGVLK